MACISADGALTESAKAMLEVLKEPLTPEEISARLGQPLYRVRSSLRELAGAGLVNSEGDRYSTTERGKDKLAA